MQIKKLILICLLLLIPSLSFAVTHGFTGLVLTASGFTDLEVLIDSGYDSARVVFVSSASGDDTTAASNIVSNGHYGVSDLTFDSDGFFQAPDGVSAFATIATAYAYCRDDNPDIILLERGGEWSAGFGVTYLNSGLSQKIPHIISSYGSSGVRPKITDVGTDSSWRSYIFMSGIHFYITDWTTEERCIDVDGGHYQTFEDNYLEGTYKEIITGGASNVVFRRNVWLHNAAHDGQIFVGSCTKSLIEENVLYEPYDQTYVDLSLFGRNIYAYGTDLVVRRNIIYASDREGLDMRAGGWADDNLIVQSYLRFGDEGTGPRSEAGGTILNNVLMEVSTNTSGGTQMRLIANNGTTVNNNVLTTGAGNIVVYQNSDSTPPLTSTKNVSIYDNILYTNAISFPNGIVTLENINIYSNQIQTTGTCIGFSSGYLAYATFSDNEYYSTAAAGDWFTQGTFAQWVTASGETGATDTEISYTAPTRTLSTYQTSLGATATTSAFMATAITLSRQNWDTDYLSNTVNNYFRAGFDVESISVTYTDPYEELPVSIQSGSCQGCGIQ